MDNQRDQVESLRAIAREYGESDNRSENSDFRLLQTLLVNYFQKYTSQVPAS